MDHKFQVGDRVTVFKGCEYGPSGRVIDCTLPAIDDRNFYYIKMDGKDHIFNSVQIWGEDYLIPEDEFADWVRDVRLAISREV